MIRDLTENAEFQNTERFGALKVKGGAIKRMICKDFGFVWYEKNKM